MKLTITLKDPDGIFDAIHQAAAEDGGDIRERINELTDQLSPWIRYGEYITIDIDTDTRTATVKQYT